MFPETSPESEARLGLVFFVLNKYGLEYDYLPGSYLPTPFLKLLHGCDMCEVCSWSDIWYFPLPALITYS